MWSSQFLILHHSPAGSSETKKYEKYELMFDQGNLNLYFKVGLILMNSHEFSSRIRGKCSILRSEFF